MTAGEITTLFGTAGTLTLMVAVTNLATDLTLLAWIQLRMVFEIAALRGDPLDDPEGQKELLVLWGVHAPTRQVGAAMGQAGQRVGKRLLLRYLRGPALQSITALFRVVEVRFSRAALIRGLPVVNVPVNAVVNGSPRATWLVRRTRTTSECRWPLSESSETLRRAGRTRPAVQSTISVPS